ncbi:MAG: hypothetical protein L0207_05550 [Chlamydiae bacterium]|nr:hypothetical protein [Chlamydiota bacterium]
MGFPRLHLFEFEDLKWMPKIFRRFITDLLTYQINHFGIYEATIGKLVEILDKTGHDTIIDLCSGSGGPALGVREKASKAVGRDIRLVLTDKYPNLEAFAAIKEKHVTSISESVDAVKVSQRLKGMRTVFTAFHHFKPEQAQGILKNAVDGCMPIGIFEITERKLVSLMTLIIAPITSLIFSLFIRPYKVSRFFWTYVIPIIPLLYTWDGLISNMRTYTKQEWLEMTNQFQDQFTWETGELISRFHIKITYLIGYPKTINSAS